MIMGAYIPTFSLKNRWHTSFGLLPNVVVIPHYDEFPAVMVNMMFGRRPAGSFVIGIDGRTALVGLEQAWQVMGAGCVTVRRGKETQHYTAGQAVPLTP